MAESNRSPRKSPVGTIKWIVFAAAIALAALAGNRIVTAQPSSLPTAYQIAGEDPAAQFERSRRLAHRTWMAPRPVVEAHRRWLLENGQLPAEQSSGIDSILGVAVGTNVDLPATQYQGETAIAVNRGNANQLVGAANTFFADPKCPVPTGTNYGTQALYGSTDGGKSWAVNCAPWPSSLNQGTGDSSFGSDPAVAWDASGNAYAAYLLVNCTGTSCGSASDAIEVVKSTDSGATWSSAGQVVNNLGNTTITDDKELMAIDTTTSLHSGRIFVIWDQGIGSAQPERVAYSDNGGATWTAVVIDTTAGAVDIGGEIAVGPGGIVYAVWNRLGFNSQGTQNSESTMFSSSPDGGATWTTPAAVVPHILLSFGSNNMIPAQDVRGINAFPALAVDRSTSANVGHIYMVYNDFPSTKAASTDTNIYFLTSTNQGLSWSTPLKVNDDSGAASQFFPWLDVDQSSGNVAVSWYDTRNSATTPNGPFTQAQIFAAESTDGGASFSANSQVSSPSSQFVNSAISYSDENSKDNPAADINQYGDYAQIAFLDGIAHPLWCDSRNFFPSNTTNVLAEDAASAQVNFTASATPTATATATATTTATPSPTPTAAAPEAKLVLRPAKTLNFPTQITLGGKGGVNSKPVRASISNPNTSTKTGGPIVVESVQISGSGFSPYPNTPPNQCVGTLNQGKTCVIQMAFSPTQPGTSLGTLTVTDNTAAGQHTITLRGTGRQGRLSYGPTSLSFSAKVGSTSTTRPVTLRNRNPVPLSIGNPSAHNPEFLINLENCVGQIPPNATCTMKVSFKPSQTGTVKDDIEIDDDAVGNPHKVNLTGTGTQ